MTGGSCDNHKMVLDLQTWQKSRNLSDMEKYPLSLEQRNRRLYFMYSASYKRGFFIDGKKEGEERECVCSHLVVGPPSSQSHPEEVLWLIAFADHLVGVGCLRKNTRRRRRVKILSLCFSPPTSNIVLPICSAWMASS